MISRISLLATASLLVAWTPALAAEFERSGYWEYQSQAFAVDGDETWNACIASTRSLDETELTLRLEPTADNGVEAMMGLKNDAWDLGQADVSVRLDIGADRWMLPGQGDGNEVDVAWPADPHLLLFLEDLASSSFAVLTARDGSTIAQFSLSGSRKAIEAMKILPRRPDRRRARRGVGVRRHGRQREPVLRRDRPRALAGLLGVQPRLSQSVRATCNFLISAMAFAGFRPLGQVWVQFMIVWQR